jgi:tetratricopeptide (TPR) repeat protein
VKSLVSLLADDGVIQDEKLERLWIDRCQKDAEEQQESERREAVRVKILANYYGGFLFVEDEQPVRGIRSLQRAAQLAPGNAPLLYFMGEHFFRTGKTRRARGYLARAYEISPGDRRVSLLLGLTCADEGDIERARELLSGVTKLGGSSFAAHYGLGRLFVAEEKWRNALEEFKLALASKASPEAHYALGCLYYQLGRDSLAARHLRKALEMDQDYGEASYLLGLASERAGQRKQATEYFEKAGGQVFRRTGRVVKRKKQSAGDIAVAPLFQQSAESSRGLITGGDRRLAEALRQDALSAFNSTDVGSR